MVFMSVFRNLNALIMMILTVDYQSIILFTTFRRSAFLFLKLAMITYGIAGVYIVSRRLSITTCTENTNIYK